MVGRVTNGGVAMDGSMTDEGVSTQGGTMDGGSAMSEDTLRATSGCMCMGLCDQRQGRAIG